MKDKVRVFATILSDRIDLASIAKAFSLHDYEKWKGYLHLDNMAVSKLLMYQKEKAEVYLYQFGCAAIVGLEEDEERELIKKLRMFLSERNRIRYDFYGIHEECFSEHARLQAEVMARSVRLEWIEGRIEALYKDAETILEKIKQGAAIRRFSKLYLFIAKLQRFELECAGVLAILGKSYKGEQREIYHHLIEEYEIHDRLSVLSEKIEMLRQIGDTHDLFGRFIGWQRLLFIEALLLIIFPLLGMIT